MPMFECSKCHAVENSALGYYWTPALDDQPALCSECHTGNWHGKFPKRTRDASWVVDTARYGNGHKFLIRSHPALYRENDNIDARFESTLQEIFEAIQQTEKSEAS